MALQKKTYSVQSAPGATTLKIVTFHVGQPVKTVEIAGRVFQGTVATLGRLYVTINCTDGQLRSLYPHQIVSLT